MIISILKETKEHEGRVALTPANVRELTRLGSKVYIQHHAGLLVGFSDSDYRMAGARILSSTRELIQRGELILKVKEPSLRELSHMREGQMVFCYWHLAPKKNLIRKILRKRIVALAYETLQLKDGSLPLLAPMSEVAGKMATQIGAHYLRSDQGGRGILMGGTTKTDPAEVLILGGGVVGENAARISMGMGATTRIVDISRVKLIRLEKKYKGRIKAYLSSRKNIWRLAQNADLIIGAVLVPGARAPMLIPKGLVKKMKRGSVIVDVAVDQGGVVETSVVTSHDKPIVVQYGVSHYGVPNIPGIVPRTATLALSTETFPYIKRLAHLGLAEACRRYPELCLAINCAYGEVVHPNLLS